MKSYACNKCGADLEKSDLKDGLMMGEYIILLCPLCDEWIMIKYEQDAKESRTNMQ